MLLSYKYINSPVGQLKLVANENALVAVLWDNENPKRVRLAELVEQLEHPVLLKTEQQLQEYFEGKRREFTLPLDFEGTAFQNRSGRHYLRFRMVKQEVIKILPFRSEMKSSASSGCCKWQNPISIIAPCHRVIGVGGALVGFAGGLDKKDILLRLEQK